MSARTAGAEQGFDVIGFEQAGIDNQVASSGAEAIIDSATPIRSTPP
jgi:hypothetical protein